MDNGIIFALLITLILTVIIIVPSLKKLFNEYKRTQYFEKFAFDNGFKFYKDYKPDLPIHVTVDYNTKFIKNIIVGYYGKKIFQLFDFENILSKSTNYGTKILVQFDEGIIIPKFELLREMDLNINSNSRIKTAFGPGIEFSNNPKFNKYYYLRSDDEACKQFFNKEIQDFFTNDPFYYIVESHGDRIEITYGESNNNLNYENRLRSDQILNFIKKGISIATCLSGSDPIKKSVLNKKKRKVFK